MGQTSEKINKTGVKISTVSSSPLSPNQVTNSPGGNDRSGNIDQVVANQNSAEQAIRVIQQFGKFIGSGVFFLLEKTNPQFIKSKQCSFRTGEKSGKTQ